jgi:hypothetical protein
MKHPLVRIIPHLFVIILLCGGEGKAQSSSTPQEPKPSATPTAPTNSPLEYGVISGSQYENSYFGLRLTIPSGWTIQGDAVKSEIKERGKESIVAKTEQEKAQFEAAVNRTLNLLTISKLPLGTPGQANALFMTIAEPVPLNMTGAVYSENLKAVLEKSQVTVKFLASEPMQTINGVPFHNLTITLGPPENLVQQKYFFLIKKGYALGLITTTVSESDNELMNGILKSVKLQ